MDVLGIEVEPALARRWAGWLAPARQPFFLTAAEAAELGLETAVRDLSPELRDTYEVWNVAKDLEVVWLDEGAFHGQPREARAELVRTQVRHGRGAVPAVADWADLLHAPVLREQADGERFVWWPTLVEPQLDAVLKRVVSEWQQPCQRNSVPEEIWRAAAPALPRARALSGTFASGSRGSAFAGGSATSCFATVMAAAGVESPDEASFETWLTAHCTAEGRDDLPGTVLVWRDAQGNNTHAAVTLGGGWGLHKPGQEWLSPHQVLTVHDLIRLAPPGVTLHRYAVQKVNPAGGL
ncbi:hypothetical protein E1263_31705 [Kribbella antibiotica]|uniref:Uncharacterized protein n=1 Tax=Kribbella antibiotica TaxID=190195 RepID=A0A4R4YXS9_9ACTN|nr:hypothetical protein [Kribbella antibiotica]TDD49770.1 hypothetical protein E1263_31705 [Kribbella antibiotica]